MPRGFFRSKKQIAIAAAVLAAGGLFVVWTATRPRTVSVCVVTDYSYRTARTNWRDVLNSRFEAAKRAFRASGVQWDFRDADQPDPTGNLDGIEERRRKLIRTECEADVILGITGLAGSRSDVPPFAHTAMIADLASESDAANTKSWIQGLAALFGVPPAHVTGGEIPKPDRTLISRVRGYDFAHGTQALEGYWGDQVYNALAAAYSGPNPTAEAHRVIGMSLAADGVFPGAIRRLKERARLDPSNPAAHADLATMYTHNFEPAQAIEEYRAAVKLEPNSAPAHAALAVATANAGLAEDAVDEFRAALSADPKFLPARSGLAYVLTQQPGRIDDAIAAYEAAIQADPTFAPAVEGLARAKSLKSKAAADAAELRRRTQAAPVQANLHFDLGLAEARSGNVETGIAELRRAVELDPSNALAQQQFALLLYRKGDRAGAWSHAQSAGKAGFELPRDVLDRIKP